MKTRIKTHQMPGDVSKFTKQAMLEKNQTRAEHSHRPKLDKKRTKSFKKELLQRERAVIKERTKKIIENQTEDDVLE